MLKAEPGNAEALLLRSRAYFMLNDLSMSKRHLAEVLKYDDGHAAARAEFKKIKDLIKLKEKVSSCAVLALKSPSGCFLRSSWQMLLACVRVRMGFYHVWQWERCSTLVAASGLLLLCALHAELGCSSV